jgi:DNA polymerase III alpha subunit
VSEYAELHCHTHFSFLEGASPPDELVHRAMELGLAALAVTDRNGLYGVVRFATAAQDAGLRSIIGIEIELTDAAVSDPAGIVVPARRPRSGRKQPIAPGARFGEAGGHAPAGVAGGHAPAGVAGGHAPAGGSGDFGALPAEGLPARPRPARARLPGYREAVKEDLRGVGERQRGPHLVLLARNAAGYRSLCRMVSHANLAGTKSMPRFTQALLADNTEGLIALSGCRDGEIARRLLVGDRNGALAVAEKYALLFAARTARRDSAATSSFFLELQHHLLPDDDWLVAETAALAAEMGLPVVVTNDVHYAYPEGRELQDVLTAIRHGRTLDELRELRRPDGESYLKSGRELMVLPPGGDSHALAGGGAGGHALAGSGDRGRALAGGRGDATATADGLLRFPSTGSAAQNANARTTSAWAEGIANTVEIAASCAVDLGFERYRFPGFPVPKGHTPFSYLEELCHDGARRRYHPMSAPVVKQLAHELDVIERTNLAEFFLICWDIMRFARSRGIPAQGRGSAADSIVAYVLGITRVDPIRHNLLFERFINEGRTTYPDVDIDFSSERREEVIQYVYARYGAEHTGMVCNLVTYRARSAVREVGYALGFPRPLVDRVAKALETYDSVMVRRDLEADGGFGQFFAETVERETAAEEARVVGGASAVAAEEARVVGGASAVAAEPLTGRLARERGGPTDRTAEHVTERGGPTDRTARPSSDERRALTDRMTERGLVDRMGQLNHPRGGRIGQVQDSGRMDSRPPADAPRFSRDTGLTGAMGESPPGHGLRTEDGSNSAPDLHGFDPVSGPGAPIPADSTGRAVPMANSAARISTYHRPHRYLGGSASGAAGWADGRSDAEASGSISGTAPTPVPTSVPTPALTPVLTPAPTPALGVEATGIADMGGGSALEQQRRQQRRRPIGSDDEGGPGDSAASIAWLARERAEKLQRPEPHSSVARVQPQPQMPPDTRRGSTAGLPHWERWLAFCARIDGFPRHLSIHTGGMLVTAAPLIDIAPLERATMPGRVVVQFDKRDVETIKLIKLDLLGLGMLAAIDETLQLIEGDCAASVDLDRIPEDVPEVFEMLRAADTVGVFQVESRAQMQTLPKSNPRTLDDLVVEVAIIRPGPIQGNAVHPYLRRRQGIEPVSYLHSSLEPVLRETLGVILYQEQVMQIAITVAGFSPAESDGFRRAMGTWRSSKEMEKLHARFVDGCRTANDLTTDQAEELFRQVAAFASFGFAKSHAAAFARTAYESAFLKLFYPAQFAVGLINAQPMGFYPVEVLINDAKRHGVAVLPVDLNASSYKTTTEWVGPGRQRAVKSSGCVVPAEASRRRWAADSAPGHGIRLGLHLVKGIGEEQAERLDAELARGPYRSLADVVARTELSEEVIERLIRAGALDSLGRPRRELLWQLREVALVRAGSSKKAAGRPMDLRLPPTPVPELPAISERERLGDSYAILNLDPRRQVVSLFRPALERLGAVTNASLADRVPGPVRLGGLVVTRQHPMTARGTVFLALEDETGMVNVTLWPDTWARLRGVVRRHALLYVEGMLQRESNVVNVVAREVVSLSEAAARVGGPVRPDGVRAMGYSGMRRA